MNLALWFVRLGDLHGTLHLFLERYVQLDGVAGPAGARAGSRRRRFARSRAMPDHMRRMRK